MARPDAASLGRLIPPEELKPGFSFEDEPHGMVEVQDLSPGMVTAIPRDKRPPGSALIVRNGRVRDDWIGRRPGTVQVGTKPNTSPVIAIIMLRLGEAITHVFRITATTIHSIRSTAIGWKPLTGSLPPAGEIIIDAAQFLDKLYVTTRISKIIEIDPFEMTFAEIAEAGEASFVTNFAERIIAARFRGPDGSTELRWSAAAIPTDFTSESAGIENLITNPSDLGDEITGLFSWTQEAVILRERTIWHMARQPFATAPFRFVPVITDLGCDLARTAVRTPFGIVFADQRTNAVWAYAPGSFPQKISTQVQDQILAGLSDSAEHKGAYDPFNKEYHLKLESGRRWIYSFEKQAWSFDDAPANLRSIAAVVEVGALVSINQETGFINQATGFINDDEPAFRVHSLVTGLDTGEVLEEDFAVVGDFGDTPGSEFELEFQSQNLGSTSRRRTLKEVLLTLTSDGGSTTLEESKNGTTWPITKTKVLTAVVKKMALRHKQITGDELYWRVKSRAVRFRVREFAVRILEKEMKLA